MSQAFPSKFLKAADLNNQRWTLTMSRVEMESLNEGEPPKPVLFFNEADKGMVLNQTNGMMIASLYSDDTDNWTGRKIELYTAIVPFQGQNVPAIRVMAPQAPMPAHSSLKSQTPASPAPGQTTAHQQAGGGYQDDPLDDEVPF